MTHLYTVDAGPVSLDLSKTLKLVDVMFLCGDSDIEWIAATLRTVQAKTLQSISLAVPLHVARGAPILEADERQGWLTIDHLLVQFSISHLGGLCTKFVT